MRYRSCCLWLLLLLGGIATAGGTGIDVPLSPVVLEDDVLDEATEPQKWFVLLGAVNTYPKLEREAMINRYYDPIMNTLMPGYGATKTFSDYRDKGFLWPPQLAFGCLVSNKVALSTHFGYSGGKIRTKKREPSLIFLLPLQSDFEITRLAYYIGLDLDYYPLGAVEQRDYAGWRDRLRSIKPALGTRLTWTYAGFNAKVKLDLWPVGTIAQVKINDSWAIPSINVNAGFDIPISRNHALVFNAGYNFFRDQQQDFDGASFTVAWRYFFR